MPRTCCLRADSSSFSVADSSTPSSARPKTPLSPSSTSPPSSSKPRSEVALPSVASQAGLCRTTRALC
eukprot:2462637-Pyramimonas_sp.AAC.1